MTLLAMPHRLFTIDEYHRMVEAGILRKEDRVELIEGEIVEMVPIGSHHQHVVDILTELLVTHARELGFIVRVQGSVQLDDRTEPEPDVALLKRRGRAYRDSLPGPADVYLLIEVADSSLLTDRRVKLPLYARHGVPETWIVNLSSGTVEVYRDPSPSGYQKQDVVASGGLVAPAAFPSLSLPMDDIFG